MKDWSTFAERWGTNDAGVGAGTFGACGVGSKHHRHGGGRAVCDPAADRNRDGWPAGDAGMGAGCGAFNVRWAGVERVGDDVSGGGRIVCLSEEAVWRERAGAT